MTIKTKVVSLCIFLVVTFAYSAQWHKIPLSTFTWVNFASNSSSYSITLTQGYPNWDVWTNVVALGTPSSYQVTYVNLTSSNENVTKAWLAMILSGKQNSQTLWVYGTVRTTGTTPNVYYILDNSTTNNSCVAVE
jgi:hypothetical protein